MAVLHGSVLDLQSKATLLFDPTMNLNYYKRRSILGKISYFNRDFDICRFGEMPYSMEETVDVRYTVIMTRISIGSFATRALAVGLPEDVFPRVGQIFLGAHPQLCMVVYVSSLYISLPRFSHASDVATAENIMRIH